MSGNGASFAMLIATLVTVCVASTVSTAAHRYVVSGSIMSYVAPDFRSVGAFVGGGLLYTWIHLVALCVLLLVAAYYINALLIQFHWGLSGPVREIILIILAAVLADGLSSEGWPPPPIS